MMGWHFQLTWNWPVWASLLAAGVAIFWVLSFYAKEKSHLGRSGRGLLVVLRLTAVALLCFLLSEPTIERNRTGKPRLVLLVDRSASMNIAGRGNQTRQEQWKRFLTTGDPTFIDRLQASFQVDLVPFADQFALLDSTANESLAETLRVFADFDAAQGRGKDAATRLGDAVDFALRELPGPRPAALVLFSDGISTRGQPLDKVANRARARGVPLYTVAVGSERRQPDVALGELIAEDVVFPGDVMSIEATVRATGFDGQVANITLHDRTLPDGATGRQLAETAVNLPSDAGSSQDAGQNIRLLIRPTKPGQLELELRVTPLPGEANVENNIVRHIVEVRDQPIRVLLVQSNPSYEYRAIKSMLERDPAIQLHVRLQEADRQFTKIDPTAVRSFPLSEEEMEAYDVVLLGDVDPGMLPRTVWPMLLRFVSEHGGGLALIAGPRFMPRAFEGYRSLDILMPIVLNDTGFQGINPLRVGERSTEVFPIQPTSLGRRDPSMQLASTVEASDAVWKSLPPVAWLLNVPQVKPGARILAEHVTDAGTGAQRLPVVLRHYVGAGEVLMHLTDETWRWRWRTDDRHFARYWGQAVRRLAHGRLTTGRGGLDLSTDRRDYRPGEAVCIRAEFRARGEAPAADQLELRIEGGAQPRHAVMLQRRLGYRGLFETTLRNLPPGSYEIKGAQESATCRFRVIAPPSELARIAVDRHALAEAARITHGKTYTIATAAQILNDLPPARPVTLQRLPPYRIASSHYAMGLFCSILILEWLLRRRGGML